MPTSTYTLANARQRITLGHEIGRGGEAAVYEVVQRAGVVVKIYHPGKLPPPGKLERMVANPPDDPTAAQGHVSIAWPRDLLRDTRGQLAGYLMAKLGGGLPLHALYNPQSRRQKAPSFHWGYLHRVARNLASAVAAIHAKGYCVGDLNESNVLVQPTALITLVDTDSFQVPNPPGAPFRCPVGKPEYTAPEIQGQDFGRIDRTEDHDRFALAVLLFQILQEGSHPFRGSGPPPELEFRIQQGLFPFAPKARTRPPPLALFAELPPLLQQMFREAFSAGPGTAGQRPSGWDWYKAMEQAENGLVACAVNAQHRYYGGQSRCTWCARAQALRGRDPFPPPSVPRQQPLPAVPMRPSPPPVVPPSPPPVVAPPPSGRLSWAWIVVIGIFLLPFVRSFLSSSPPPPAPPPPVAAVPPLAPVAPPPPVAAVPPPAPVAPAEPEMVEIAGGSFEMGCGPDDNQCSSDEKPRHRVTIRPFLIGKYEVTRAQFQRFRKDYTYQKGEENLPAANITWFDAKDFCEHFGYRLPTEAEWEYAARAGTRTRYSFGDGESKLGEYAWYDKNSGGRVHPVGTRQPNPWGLYDMHGNVWEWVQDCYHDNYSGAPTDGSAWEVANCLQRVLRGGSFLIRALLLRSAFRFWIRPEYWSELDGFRCARGPRRQP